MPRSCGPELVASSTSAGSTGGRGSGHRALQEMARPLQAGNLPGGGAGLGDGAGAGRAAAELSASSIPCPWAVTLPDPVRVTPGLVEAVFVGPRPGWLWCFVVGGGGLGALVEAELRANGYGETRLNVAELARRVGSDWHTVAAWLRVEAGRGWLELPERQRGLVVVGAGRPRWDRAAWRRAERVSAKKARSVVCEGAAWAVWGGARLRWRPVLFAARPPRSPGCRPIRWPPRGSGWFPSGAGAGNGPPTTPTGCSSAPRAGPLHGPPIGEEWNEMEPSP